VRAPPVGAVGTSARAYVAGRMAAGLSGDKLGDAVLRKLPNLVDDLPALSGHDFEDLILSEDGYLLPVRQRRTNALRLRIGLCEAGLIEAREGIAHGKSSLNGGRSQVLRMGVIAVALPYPSWRARMRRTSRPPMSPCGAAAPFVLRALGC
jgi:hypothetical protein